MSQPFSPVSSSRPMTSKINQSWGGVEVKDGEFLGGFEACSITAVEQCFSEFQQLGLIIPLQDLCPKLLHSSLRGDRYGGTSLILW